jgi:hypothetical protein
MNKNKKSNISSWKELQPYNIPICYSNLDIFTKGKIVKVGLYLDRTTNPNREYNLIF